MNSKSRPVIRPLFLFIFAATSFLGSCSHEDPLFRLVPSGESGIDFRNDITETDSLNILSYEYAYNGGGVAVADFNDDGLEDIFLVGNRVANRLYLNMGRLTFTDVSTESGVTGTQEKWYSGVSVVDINTDGLPDIYLSVTGSNSEKLRRDELYIHQGMSANGIPHFKEQATEYGLSAGAFTTQVGFFDYDNDGDLDMYQMVAATIPEVVGTSGRQYTDMELARLNTDKLYRNDWSEALGHPVFTDVSEEAGINKEGYGLGINIVDINRDGWKDVYVSNDYISEDLFWVNNGNGTFTDWAGKYFKHTSFSGMGTDIQDLNNDGRADILTLDMAPEDNVRRQTMTSPNNYRNYFGKAFAGFQEQYTRNTLQLNQGMHPAMDGLHPLFSEIAYVAGVAFTDWSWGPLVADFDNNGFRDMIITNGIVKDKTNRDFVAFRDDVGNVAPAYMLLDAIPELKIPNYAFRNNGDLTFTNATRAWGVDQPSFSTGGAWADLDNDGDLDVVINNINQQAFLYENLLDNNPEKRNNWLKVVFQGEEENPQALGAISEIYYNDNKHQRYEHTIYRGYLSTVASGAHFGLGKTSVVDSLVVTWPNGQQQIWKDIPVNKVFTADIAETGAMRRTPSTRLQITQKALLFTNVTESKALSFKHQEKEFYDFRSQRLLPHKLSQYGPALAAGDVNGDGFQDIVIGGSYGKAASVYLQQRDGAFIYNSPHPRADNAIKKQEDMGVLLFDADHDADLDMYVVSGSVENIRRSVQYQDRLYENDGHGRFSFVSNALPQFHVSGLAVKASDYDRDGDLDLFVGGRVAPGRYPEAVSSYILQNNSRNGNIQFKDVTNEVAPFLKNLGMVTDALWTDVDNDGWQDLIIVGEWMPVSIFRNRQGTFEDVTAKTGIGFLKGWWNSLVGGDFDNDGDTDYIAGNLGLNSLYKASVDEPVGIYAGDFEGNGILTAIPTLYLSDGNRNRKEFPAHGKDDVTAHLQRIRKQFSRHYDFGKATIQDVLSADELENALVYKANWLRTSYVENRGDGTFKLRALPMPAQFAPVFGMVADDFNGDGNLDVILSGNEFGAEVQIGRYDAFNGLMLAGHGDGTFSAIDVAESGVYIPGDGKALVKLAGSGGTYLLAASQNQAGLKLFESEMPLELAPLRADDVYAMVHYDDGRIRKEEFYYGTSFLSASGRFMVVTPMVSFIEIVDFQGNTRTLTFE